MQELIKSFIWIRLRIDDECVYNKQNQNPLFSISFSSTTFIYLFNKKIKKKGKKRGRWESWVIDVS